MEGLFSAFTYQYLAQVYEIEPLTIAIEDINWLLYENSFQLALSSIRKRQNFLEIADLLVFEFQFNVFTFSCLYADFLCNEADGCICVDFTFYLTSSFALILDGNCS